MPRLIDADMLEPSEVYMNYGFTRIVYMDDIDELPTVDAEPVVRCKDCIRYYADPWGYGNCVFEGGVSRRTKESDFCSWGERKEDAKTN